MVEVSKGNICMGICITYVYHVTYLLKLNILQTVMQKKKIKEKRNQKGKSINRQSNNKI